MSSKEYYIDPTTDGKLSWRNVSSCTYDSGDTLENWQLRLHEVSLWRCAIITRVFQRVGAEASALPMYEAFPNLASFFEEFEENFIEWWGTHK